MIIEFYTKNFSLIHTMHIDAKFVPRVGEELGIVDSDLPVPKGKQHLVHDVTYLILDGKLTPLVKCHDSFGASNRLIVLKENGWAEPD